MRCLLASVIVLGVCAGPLLGQDTPAAKATRKKLKEKITIEFKELPMREAMGEIKREFNNRLGIKIDNVSGISNNSKISYTAKEQTLEKILNDLSDKYEFGYIVLSKNGDRYDGWIIVRKSKDKERGYEAGKEPKKTKGAQLTPDRQAAEIAALFFKPPMPLTYREQRQLQRAVMRSIREVKVDPGQEVIVLGH